MIALPGLHHTERIELYLHFGTAFLRGMTIMLEGLVGGFPAT